MNQPKILNALFTGLLVGSCNSISDNDSSTIPVTDTPVLAGEVFDEVNRYRKSQTLPALRRHRGLADLAEKHSFDMALKGRMSHKGFSTRSATAINRFKFLRTGENVIAYGERPVTAGEIVQRWLASPSHRTTILSPHTHGGLAFAEKNGIYYGTMFFGTKPQ